MCGKKGKFDGDDGYTDEIIHESRQFWQGRFWPVRYAKVDKPEDLPAFFKKLESAVRKFIKKVSDQKLGQALPSFAKLCRLRS